MKEQANNSQQNVKHVIEQQYKQSIKELKRFMRRYKVTQSELAKNLSKDVSQISNIFNYKNIPSALLYYEIVMTAERLAYQSEKAKAERKEHFERNQQQEYEEIQNQNLPF